MTNVLLFGGQGGQQPGMFTRWSHLKTVQENINIAGEILQEDAWAWDSTEALQGTRLVQLSLLVLQTGVARALIEEGLDVHYAAGHSLGAWSAAVATGSLPFGDAVRMVNIRGIGMAASAPRGYGMIAVIGLKEHILQRLVDEVTEAGGEAWISNLNAPLQITVSGADSALDNITEAAKHSGAQKVARLKVAVPAHSSLMTPARERLESAMDDVTVQTPRFPVLANTTGRLIRNSAGLKQDLVSSTDQPVNWGRGVAALAERGVDKWIQIPPGRQLIALLPRDDQPVDSWCVDNVGLVDTLVKARR